MKITKRSGVRKLGWLFGLVPLVFSPLFAPIDITITGSWSFTLSSGNLQGGAGSDFPAEYESASNQVLLKIGGKGVSNWRIDVTRIDTSWPSSVKLYIRRTGEGTGKGTIYDGTDYHEVTTTTTTWMTGDGGVDNVPIQEKVGSLSVGIGQATYTTAIQYTAVQTG